MKVIGDRWLWLMDVMFGGIAIIEFQRLIDSTLTINSCPSESIILTFVGAISVFIFFIYDVTVLHFLYKKYPYNLTWLSTSRFLIDLIMVFLLAMVIIPVMTVAPYKSTVTLLLSVSIWHIFALLWHLLAEYESNQAFPPIKQILQHLINPATYWTVATFTILFTNPKVTIEAYKQTYVFVVVCVAIVIASIIRSATLIPRMQEALKESETL